MFRTNRSRTILTILGISVGIGTILFLVSFGYGLQQLILNQITTSEALLSLDVTVPDLPGLKLDQGSYDEIIKIPGVDKISPLIAASAQLKIADVTSEITVNFADSEYFKLDGTILERGDFYTAKDKDQIIISSASLLLFNLDKQDAFNKMINIAVVSGKKNANGTKEIINLGDDFRIVGIIEDENSSFVYLPFDLSRDMGFDNFNKLKVKIDKEADLDTVRNALLEKNYSVSALSDIIEQANQIFKVTQIVLSLFGIIALMVSAIGMFNTMTIALLERTQEIGIMKSLGATSADVWNMFLSEAVIIGFAGGLGGIGIGLLGGEIFNYGINFLAGRFGGSGFDLFYTPMWFIGLVISFSTIVGLITGFYPAKRAAGISPLEAIRYK
jgi:putative ABC transport system permease protein